MKYLMLIVVALLIVATTVTAQKQPLTTFKGGIQGERAAMLKGPHDFTPDSGKYAVDTIVGGGAGGADSIVYHPYGASKNLCRYCHAAHVPVTGIARPLWIRASQVGKTFGTYSNPTSLDATVEDAGSSDNYSSFCLSCHDGSQMFIASAYTEGSRPRASSGFDWTASEAFTVPEAANVVDGEFDLEHVHPVNFNYVNAAAADPQGIYPAAGAPSYVVKSTEAAGNRNEAGTSTVRLFDSYMQCSSCHNPHMSGGIGMVHTTDYGKLCVSCHRK